MSVEWYCNVGGSEYGPLTASDLKRMAGTGKLEPHHRVRRGEKGEWVQASNVKGLEFKLAEKTPPAVPGKGELIQFPCPHCKTDAWARESLLTLKVRCPKCLQPVPVPGRRSFFSWLWDVLFVKKSWLKEPKARDIYQRLYELPIELPTYAPKDIFDYNGGRLAELLHWMRRWGRTLLLPDPGRMERKYRIVESWNLITDPTDSAVLEIRARLEAQHEEGDKEWCTERLVVCRTEYDTFKAWVVVHGLKFDTYRSCRIEDR
jgi:hypothetical protein